ncbi:unnamed protein product [Orchesella dallaii]|uniref:G-protein coupled receptors family 1 profile domain-containing protein n=1 Tax=Orchesella dallaii TaxID=48710 RepID=A0ABP1PSI4_9HEXA
MFSNSFGIIAASDTASLLLVPVQILGGDVGSSNGSQHSVVGDSERNLMVILVVTLHWRMRSITNFCLANLAFADLCVGIFCVYQNIVTYLMDSWIFGEFMCKMYHFVNSLSTTASILILVVISIERYLAIIHPMTCKQILTPTRLRITIFLVWVLSAAISSPRFYYFSTIRYPLSNGQYEILCLPNRTKYNSKLLDTISMTLLFLIPLAIISVLYTQIGVVLWETSGTKMPTASGSLESGSCYKEGDIQSENSVVHTVNLTLLPNNSIQQQLYQPKPNRPTIHCKGMFPTSKNQTTGEKKCNHCGKRSSFLRSSSLICVNRNKKQEKGRHPFQCRQLDEKNGHFTCRFLSSNEPLVASCRTQGIENSPCLSTVNAAARQEEINYGAVANQYSAASTVVNHSRSQDLRANCAEQFMNSEMEKVCSSPTSNCCCGSRCQIRMCKKNASSKKVVTFSTPLSPLFPFPSDSKCDAEFDEKSSKMGSNVLVKYEKKGHSSKSTILVNRKSHHSTTDQCENESDSDTFDPDLDSVSSENGHSTFKFKPKTTSNLLSSRQSNRANRFRVVNTSRYGTKVLQSRRRVVKMLIVVVLTFAICHLPFHARKVWQYMSSNYQGGSVFSQVFTPLTFLIMYVNSGINPILYAFMSKKIRMSFRDLLCCNIRQSLKISRNASVRSKHVVASKHTSC